MKIKKKDILRTPREYLTSRPHLKELLKEVSQAAGKWYQMETGYIISEAESVDTENTE